MIFEVHYTTSPVLPTDRKFSLHICRFRKRPCPRGTKCVCVCVCVCVVAVVVCVWGGKVRVRVRVRVGVKVRVAFPPFASATHHTPLDASECAIE